MSVTVRPGTGLADAEAAVRAALGAAGIAEAAREARVLVREATGLGSAALLARPDLALDTEAAGRLAAWATRRAGREPVARILGCHEFWGLPFRLSPATLVPRQDSETLVETALALAAAPSMNPTVLDLGTGSGCLLTAILHERPDLSGLGLDRSEDAVRTARDNARRNGVGDRARFAVADWAAPLAARFGLVVSNPPYIASDIVPTLDPEVRLHDPALALDGGPDGLAAYRRLLSDTGRLLAPDGLAVFEVGYDQAASVSGLVEAHGFAALHVAHDLAGQPRAVAFRK